MSTILGTRVSRRYRVDSKIAVGGMSTVYRAWDEVLERCVAIKVLHRHIAADSDQLARFGREARAVAQLAHPHIVGVIDAGEDSEAVDGEGLPFIVFEYVEGETLKERIGRLGRLEIPEAVAYAIEIGRALGFAHARKVVHRDVKPQNVLLDAEGSAKVTDFGIARTLDEDGLTAEGRVLGTTDYVSPEQALGRDVTGQSDLYSLGIVLFEMLAGAPPFRGENQVAVAMKHVRDPMPDVREARPEVSAALAAVVDRATSKDLGRRYRSASAMIFDLEDALALEASRAGAASGEATSVLRTLPEPTRARLPRRLRGARPLGAALLVALVAAVGLVLPRVVDPTSGTGPGPGDTAGGTKLAGVSLRQTAAHPFDPQGDGEHPEQAPLVLDRDPGTTWRTETYGGGAFAPPKTGVGIYVDASPGLAARSLVVGTPTRGWRARIYGATGSSAPAQLRGWQPLTGERTLASGRTSFALDTGGRPLRYYLLWITGLPPGGQVAVAELELYRRAGTSAAALRRRSAG